MATRQQYAIGLKQVSASSYDFPGSRMFKRGDTTPAEMFSDSGVKRDMGQITAPQQPSVPKIAKPKGITGIPKLKGKF
jgi:hypothetical protein